jgi:hypothetical protein
VTNRRRQQHAVDRQLCAGHHRAHQHLGASVAFSADTGASSTDLITKTAAQTISGILSSGLASGEACGSLAQQRQYLGHGQQQHWQRPGRWPARRSGSNTLQVRVVDAAGNLGAASSSAYVLDTTGPTASLSSNVSVLKSGETALITVTFNEAPGGLTWPAFSATGGTLANLTATANPRIYTVEFTPNAGVSGLLGSVSLAAASYTDLAGNNGAARSRPSFPSTRWAERADYQRCGDAENRRDRQHHLHLQQSADRL